MAYGIQCCVRCSTLEHGHTGYGNRYICTDCHRVGWRVDAGGNISQSGAPIRESAVEGSDKTGNP